MRGLEPHVTCPCPLSHGEGLSLGSCPQQQWLDSYLKGEITGLRAPDRPVAKACAARFLGASLSFSENGVLLLHSILILK